METTEFEQRFGRNIQYLRTKYFLINIFVDMLLCNSIFLLCKIDIFLWNSICCLAATSMI